jgi:hypothetical protein
MQVVNQARVRGPPVHLQALEADRTHRPPRAETKDADEVGARAFNMEPFPHQPLVCIDSPKSSLSAVIQEACHYAK